MGSTFLILTLALGLRFGSWKFTSSCLALQQAAGSCSFFWTCVRQREDGFQVLVQPTDCLCEALWVKCSLPDLGGEVMLKAVLAPFFQG